MCKHKNKGRLGVKDLHLINLALLANGDGDWVRALQVFGVRFLLLDIIPLLFPLFGEEELQVFNLLLWGGKKFIFLDQRGWPILSGLLIVFFGLWVWASILIFERILRYDLKLLRINSMISIQFLPNKTVLWERLVWWRMETLIRILRGCKLFSFVSYLWLITSSMWSITLLYLLT